jgi:hypothetical protein
VQNLRVTASHPKFIQLLSCAETASVKERTTCQQFIVNKASKNNITIKKLSHKINILLLSQTYPSIPFSMMKAVIPCGPAFKSVLAYTICENIEMLEKSFMYD